MKRIALASAVLLGLTSHAAFAQSGEGASVRVQPGHFCFDNKCVRFSRDLTKVSIQARRPVSVEAYGLRENPVISSQTFREIFALALRQVGINGNRG